MVISKCSFRHLQNSTSKNYDTLPAKLKLLPHKYKSHTALLNQSYSLSHRQKVESRTWFTKAKAMNQIHITAIN